MQPIPTKYRDVEYRSRTEARWALFLDEIRVPYAYEPEGFDLGGEWYLPDFWLPTPGTWLEVKGIAPNEREVRVAKLLSKLSRCPVFIAVGPPSVSGEYNILTFRDGQQLGNVSFAGSGETIAIVSECQSVGFVVRGSISDLPGVPEPLTGPARAAMANRFGVYEASPDRRTPIRGLLR